MGEWKKLTIESIGSVKTGPFGAQLHQRDYVKEGGTPIITVEHLSERGLIHKNLPLVSDADKNRLDKYLLKKNDIVFSRVGSVDRCSIVSKKEDGWLFSGRLLRIRPKENKVYSRYLVQLFQTEKFKHHMRSIAVGGIMPSLNTNILSRVYVTLPPISEQKAIADILQTWDAAIEKTESLINAKESQFGWLVMRLLNKSGYKRKQLSGFIEEVSKRNRNNGIERVLSVTNHSGFVLPESQFERRVASANVTNYKIVQQGQYAYNPSRINVGSIARLDKWSNGILSPMYTVFKLDETVLDSDYFLHWLSSNEARQRIKKSAQGSVRETVSFGDLKTISIRLPDISVQQKISNILNTAHREIDLLKKLAEQYRSQKRGLMQKLLSGEWHIKKGLCDD